SRQAMLVAGGGLALLAATVPLLRGFDAESLVLAPVQSVVNHEVSVLLPKLPLSGFTERDVLALVFAIAALLGAGIWRYARRARSTRSTAWGSRDSSRAVRAGGCSTRYTSGTSCNPFARRFCSSRARARWQHRLTVCSSWIAPPSRCAWAGGRRGLPATAPCL